MCGDLSSVLTSVRDCDAWCKCEVCRETVAAFADALRDLGGSDVGAEHTGGGCEWLSAVVGPFLVAVTGGTALTEANLPTDSAAVLVGVYGPGWETEAEGEDATYLDTDLARFRADVGAALAAMTDGRP
jgi:hypothetical protein